MRAYCLKCNNAADFIDLLTLRCETCLSEDGLDAVNRAKLVSRQTVEGALACARLTAQRRGQIEGTTDMS